MGIGDSIGKAAENAMEDLAGTSKPTETAHVPEPTDPNPLSAALRETSEETGFACRAFPVTLATRAPGESEEAGVKDEVRVSGR